MDQNPEIILSVVVPVFNHENYICQAMDSIYMQKTKYKFEVLVGEDCSTDNTRAVLKEWEAKHPGFATVFYREKNMNHEKIPNGRDLFLRCRGKYIICLEGDDFWTDEYKIEKQISFLESHPEYIAVAHNCVVVDENGLPNGERIPECRHEEFTLNDCMHHLLPGQTATVMYRNYRFLPGFNDSFAKATDYSPGDRRLYFSLVTQGRVYCIQKVMSAYRHVTTHGSSFSATHRFSFDESEKWLRKQLEFSYELKKNKVIDAAKKMYVSFLCAMLRRHVISFKTFCTCSKNIKWCNIYYCWFFFYWLNVRLFKKDDEV